MIKVTEGKLIGKGLTFCIVASRFNDFITSRLVDGATDALLRHDVDEKNIQLVWVPGGFELPLACKKIAQRGACDAIIALGAIIKGDTPHNDYIARECAKGIAQVMLDTGVPISFGVITPDTLEQAIERAGTKAGNKGAQAALAVLELVNVLKSL